MKFKSSVFEEASGKMGNVVLRNTVYGQIAARAPKTASTPRRSEDQFKNRGQLPNIGGNHGLYSGKQEKAFENKPATLSEYNMMVKINWGVSPVYLPKNLKMQGAVIVAPYIYCMGSLPSIGMSLNQGGVLVTDIALGGLEIGADTTVAQFSQAVIGQNSAFEEQDQITFFYAQQTFDALNVPRATMETWKVVLDLYDGTKLLTMVSGVGFASVGGYLGMGTVLQNGGASWTHTRNNGSSSIKVSTQRLFCVNEILAQYQSVSAMKAAADSYGGINRSAVYLDPASSLNYVNEAYENGSQTGGGGASQGGSTGGNSGGNGSGGSPSTGSGTENGSGGSQNSGGTTGGGTGSVTPMTVNAPTFSGETQFTDTTTVTMTAESGAEIRYTTNGSTPTASSTLYSAPVTLTETTTVKAIAIKNGVSSSVTERTYTKSAGNGGGEELGGNDH